MRRLRQSVLTLLTSSTLFATSALAGVAVSPMVIEKAITATDNQLEVVVSNSSTEPMRITLSTAPLGHDRRGAPVEMPGYAYDVSQNIELAQPEFILQPRRWRRVRASVKLPERTGGGYALLYVKALPANLPATTTVVTALRVAVLVELSFPGTRAPETVL